MTRTEFQALLEEMLEKDPGTLPGDTRLAELEGWDSMAVLSFIALMDEHFELPVHPRDIAACVTVDDLARLAGDRIA